MAIILHGISHADFDFSSCYRFKMLYNMLSSTLSGRPGGHLQQLHLASQAAPRAPPWPHRLALLLVVLFLVRIGPANQRPGVPWTVICRESASWSLCADSWAAWAGMGLKANCPLKRLLK